ncbi:hypothetical protein [Moorena producens]|uniref:hypothetical protein n=1 Tax=Moorena producens TaxID=1155739 RepID=UPI001314CFD0|nr:hypothetical protein [Moorena producens]
MTFGHALGKARRFANAKEILPTTAHKFLTRAILIQTLPIHPLLVGSAYNDYGLLI